MANKTLQERVRETIYPNGVGAITAEKEQALLIEFADVIDEKANKSDISEDVYIGETEPTDEKVKVWINPNEEANNIQAKTTSGGGTSGGIARVWVQEIADGQLTESQLADNIKAYNALMNRETYSVEVLFMMNDLGENGWAIDRYLVGTLSCLPTANVIVISIITGFSEEGQNMTPFYLNPNGSVSLQPIE